MATLAQQLLQRGCSDNSFKLDYGLVSGGITRIDRLLRCLANDMGDLPFQGTYA